MAGETNIVAKILSLDQELSVEKFAFYIKANLENLDDKPFSIQDLNFIASQQFWDGNNSVKEPVFRSFKNNTGKNSQI